MAFFVGEGLHRPPMKLTPPFVVSMCREVPKGRQHPGRWCEPLPKKNNHFAVLIEK